MSKKPHHICHNPTYFSAYPYTPYPTHQPQTDTSHPPSQPQQDKHPFPQCKQVKYSNNSYPTSHYSLHVPQALPLFLAECNYTHHRIARVDQPSCSLRVVLVQCTDRVLIHLLCWGRCRRVGIGVGYWDSSRLLRCLGRLRCRWMHYVGSLVMYWEK